MALSSINFQKSKANSVDETTRKFEAKYLLPKEIRQQNEYWDCGKTEEEVFTEELKISKPKGGRKPKLENSLWEGVLNLNKNHKLKDVQKVAKLIEKKFNIKCTRIAIHRDEGKVLDDGTVKYNYHAHLNFVTYKDGKQNWRRALIGKKELAELQTVVAKSLKMERGKVGSTAVRASHRVLRENYDGIMAQRQAPVTVQALKKELEELRKELKTANKKADTQIYDKTDYQALNKLKKALNKDTVKEIYQAYLALQKELLQKEKENKSIEKKARAVFDDIDSFVMAATGQKIESKKDIIEARETILKQKTTISSLESKKSVLEANISDLEAKNKSLSTANSQLQSEIAQKDETISFYKQQSAATESGEVVQLKEKVQELEKENSSLRKEVSYLRSMHEKNTQPADEYEKLLNESSDAREEDFDELLKKLEQKESQNPREN